MTPPPGLPATLGHFVVGGAHTSPARQRARILTRIADAIERRAARIAELETFDTGLPVTLVHGIGEAAGAALVAHPGVPRISFTGETTTGQTIMAAAAPHLKGLSMELGGRSPCVIFADADLDAATDSALFGAFSLNGERCTAGSRILAERSVYHALVTRLATRAEHIRVGDPADPRTELGALVHPEHYARARVRARRAGGRRAAGGRRRPPGPPARGELPGRDGVRRRRRPDADLPRGDLRAGGVRHPVRGRGRGGPARQRHLLRAGRLHLDQGPGPRARDLRTPFGGVKASGLGREGGPHSLDFYTESRIVRIPLGDTGVPRFGA
jgi:5-carboxymethyl-2-hydroxymuconic-semialdehyde dehydrogenase